MKFFVQLMLLCLSTVLVAQTQISGTVTDKDGQPVPGANVVVDNLTGAVTDFDGNFSLSTAKTPPFTISVSSVGLRSQTVTVSSSGQSLSISLNEAETQLDEIVVSASRMAESIFESPVTIEKMSVAEIQNTPSADFYNGLGNLKYVNMLEAGMLFSQISIRGFSDLYNEGLVTLVDGMNNQAPVFGFAVGNLIGLHEVDMQSVELIPGAASALYGADAYKGIVFMNSISPFDKQGISVSYKTGITEQDSAGTNDFIDIGVRMAAKLSDKLAIKATIAHKEGTDWSPEDYSHYQGDNYLNPAYNPENPDHDALHEEGQRSFTTSLIFDQLADLAGNPAISTFTGYSPNYFDVITSTGYTVKDLFGNESFNTKGNFSIHYRPSEDSEFTAQSVIGTGRSLLPTGNTMYNINNFKIQQHKLNYKKGGLNAKFYFTQEDAGDTAVGALTGVAVANSAPGGLLEAWGVPYLQTYLGVLANSKGYPAGLAGVGALLGDIQTHIVGTALTGGDTTALRFNDLFGGSTVFAHNLARAAADANLLQPGTPEFDAANSSAQSLTLDNPGVGSRIQDLSKVYNYEVDYDFGNKFDFGKVIVGASYRNYVLDTGGTLYTDADGPIEYYDYGAYAQVKTDLFDDFVSVTGSLRYDKQEVIDVGNVTPRLGLVFNLNDNQNIRLSAQQGFRNPTNQDKFIGYDNTFNVILGGVKSNIERFNKTLRLRNGETYTFTGQYVLDNAVEKSDASASNLGYVKAETVTMLEMGYRFNSPGFTVDASAYFSSIKDKIAGRYVDVPVLTSTLSTPAAAVAAGSYYDFQVDSNFNETFSAYGFSVEATGFLTNGLFANVIYEYNELDYDPADDSALQLSWNTPDHRVKAGLLFKKGDLTLSANARYNSEFLYESSYVNALIESNTVIDAKLSYKLPYLNAATLEVGGNNIGGDNYVSLPGAGLIGTTYYAGLKLDL